MDFRDDMQLPDSAGPCGALPADQSASHPLPPGGLSWALKAALERTLAVFLLVPLAPVLLVIALAIRLDSPGPVLFVQPRFGRNARPFPCLKFRTMRQDLADPSGGAQTGDADPRITRFGWLLRRTSLDELPQLFNVLRGDMLLIGPRAHPCGMRVEGQLCADLDPLYHSRHAVPPGITGWAQVNGSRGAVKTAASLRRRVLLDRDYIRDWSLRRDLLVMLRTLGVVIHDGKGV